MTKVKRERNLIPLWDEKRFDMHIKHSEKVIVGVYHFLCPHCHVHLNMLNALAGQYYDKAADEKITFCKIHLHLDWINEKADLSRHVENENTFLLDRYDIGKSFPSTLFFRNGTLLKVVNGAKSLQEMKAIISEVYGG